MQLSSFLPHFVLLYLDFPPHFYYANACNMLIFNVFNIG